MVFEKSFNSNGSPGLAPYSVKKSIPINGVATIRKVKVRDKDNQLLTENFIDFEVFNSEDLKVPKAKVAVLDFKGNLKNFLHKSNVKTIEFNQSTPKNIPVLVSTHKAENEKELRHFERLLKFVEEEAPPFIWIA